MTQTVDALDLSVHNRHYSYF